MLSRPYYTVCLDANVVISGVAFGGKPAKLIEYSLKKIFQLVTCTSILNEIKRNLLNKLDFPKHFLDQFINDLTQVASLLDPPGGKINITPNKGDNLILELVELTSCDFLVTGDKKHLLPLKKIGPTIIETPSEFLKRIE